MSYIKIIVLTSLVITMPVNSSDLSGSEHLAINYSSNRVENSNDDNQISLLNRSYTQVDQNSIEAEDKYIKTDITFPGCKEVFIYESEDQFVILFYSMDKWKKAGYMEPQRNYAKKSTFVCYRDLIEGIINVIPVKLTGWKLF